MNSNMPPTKDLNIKDLKINNLTVTFFVIYMIDDFNLGFSWWIKTTCILETTLLRNTRNNLFN